MFGLKTKKELIDLKAEFLRFKEEKGFFSDNTDNIYFQQMFNYLNSTYKLLDFDGVNREELMKYYKNNAQVRGVINLIANAVSELSDYVEITDKEDELVEKHPVLDLLAQPNDRDTLRKLVKAWAVNRLITGDAFTYGEQGVGLNRGKFKGLYIIPSHQVDILVGDITKPIRGYKLKNYPYLKADLNNENVKMSFEYNPDGDTFFGLSPLVAAANYLQVLENGLKRQNTAVLNGGVASIVTPKPDAYGGITEVQSEQVEEEMNKKSNINRNKFIRVPLEVHRMGDTPTDLSILETSKDAVMALCFVYNIPVDIYLGQAKYENTKEAKKAIYEQAGIPLFKEWLSDMTDFLKLKKENLKLTLNADRIEVLQKSATDHLGALEKMNATINEKREYMMYPRIEEPYADKPIIPMGVSLGYEVFDINDNDL